MRAVSATVQGAVVAVHALAPSVHMFIQLIGLAKADQGAKGTHFLYDDHPSDMLELIGGMEMLRLTPTRVVICPPSVHAPTQRA